MQNHVDTTRNYDESGAENPPSSEGSGLSPRVSASARAFDNVATAIESKDDAQLFWLYDMLGRLNRNATLLRISTSSRLIYLHLATSAAYLARDYRKKGWIQSAIRYERQFERDVAAFVEAREVRP